VLFAPPAFSPGCARSSPLASFAIPSNRAANPITVIFIAAMVGAVFGGAAYLAMTVLRAAWDAAVAGMKGRLRDIGRR
jgi:hypothetical protein